MSLNSIVLALADCARGGQGLITINDDGSLTLFRDLFPWTDDQFRDVLADILNHMKGVHYA